MEAKQSSLKQFFSLIISTNIPKYSLFFGLLTSVITTLTGLAVPLLTKNLVDGFSISSLSPLLIIAIAIAFILQAILGGLSLYLLTAVGQKVVSSLRDKMWTRLIRLPTQFFDKTSSGQVVSRVVNDTSIVRDLIAQHFPDSISGVFSIIGAITLLLIMDWKMTLIMLIVVPIIIVIMIPLGRRMTKISRDLQDETAAFTGNTQQTLSEIRLMKVSTAEDYEEKKGLSDFQKLLTLGLKEARIIALIAPIMQFVVMFVIVGIIAYGGLRVSSGDMTTGTLVAFLPYLFQIIVPLTSLTMFLDQLLAAHVTAELIVDILDVPLEHSQTGKYKVISVQPLRVEDGLFAYEKDEPIIQVVFFSANAGEVVALVVPSGGRTA